MTDEIVLSKDNQGIQGEGNRVQIETDRLHHAGAPGQISQPQGTKVDADLSIAQQDALLGWLNEVEQESQEGTEDDAAALRRRLAGVLAGLPEAIKKHLEALLALEQRVVEGHERAVAEVDRVGEHERMELEESMRRLARSLHGGLTHKRTVVGRGRIDSGRTMRRNMRFDGIPFSPITVRRREDKPRLVILTDVSLSVRATARFTLHLVHGLQNLFAQVRAFAFVADLVEITDLFTDHPVEQALGLVFGGDVLDVDANSDYGAAFGRFTEDYGSAVNRRTTVIVLGDGRGNGNDPNTAAFAEITRRARETIWLTPEPRYSWRLGGCDLPDYAEYCSRVRVVRDLTGLESAAAELARNWSAVSRGRVVGGTGPMRCTTGWSLRTATGSPAASGTRSGSSGPDPRDQQRSGRLDRRRPGRSRAAGPGRVRVHVRVRGVLDRPRTGRGLDRVLPQHAAELAAGGAAGGTNAGMAPVHERAAALAVGDVVELGCCFGFLSLRLAAAGHRVTAVDLVPGHCAAAGTRSPRCAVSGAGLRDAGRRRAGRAAGRPLRGHRVRGAPAGAPAAAASTRRCSPRCCGWPGAGWWWPCPFEDEPNPTWGHIRTFDPADAHRPGRGHRPPVRGRRAPRWLAHGGEANVT